MANVENINGHHTSMVTLFCREERRPYRGDDFTLYFSRLFQTDEDDSLRAHQLMVEALEKHKEANGADPTQYVFVMPPSIAACL